MKFAALRNPKGDWPGAQAMLISVAMATEYQSDLTDYSPDGVDLTLIRWMLSLTPAERLEFVEQSANEILAIRELNARA